ncbi:MAG: NAD-dependent epimerase/dehydratase family protein [Clostridiaceae bacterium]|nr:NAD-dependent epimerase/dehydratase family protein [Clostridiaceae bacterium]
MKILVIGGSGHVGSHLVPILVSHGHDVAIGSRGRTAVQDGLAKARLIPCNSGDLDSLRAVAAAETFDAVVDFPGTAWNVWQAFRDTAEHIVACGSLWMFGLPHVVPTPERTQETCVFEGYEKRYQQIIDMLADSRRHRAAFTAVMPPNICGPGKIPLDTLGGRDIEVHRANMRGDVVYLPDGPEALISPCDAYDLAMTFALAIENRTAAAGQIFNGGSAYALTSSQFIRAMGRIYHSEIPIEYVPWERYKSEVSPGIGYWWHFYAHMCPDISKARALLGYKPLYTPEETLERAVDWMRKRQML